MKYPCEATYGRAFSPRSVLQEAQENRRSMDLRRPRGPRNKNSLPPCQFKRNGPNRRTPKVRIAPEVRAGRGRMAGRRAAVASRRAKTSARKATGARKAKGLNLASAPAATAASVSPLAPKSFPVLPPLAGVRLATAAAGIRYRDRLDTLLAVIAGGP